MLIVEVLFVMINVMEMLIYGMLSELQIWKIFFHSYFQKLGTKNWSVACEQTDREAKKRRIPFSGFGSSSL